MCVRWAWGWRWLCQTEWKRRSRRRRVRMNRAPEHGFSVSVWWVFPCPATSLLLLHPCRSRLALGMMPVLSRVAGTCPAGNQHFLMPFGADHAHRAGINSPPFQYVPATYRDWQCNFTPFPCFLCLTHGAPSPQIISTNSLWLPLSCFQKDPAFFDLAVYLFFLISFAFMHIHTDTSILQPLLASA